MPAALHWASHMQSPVQPVLRQVLETLQVWECKKTSGQLTSKPAEGCCLSARYHRPKCHPLAVSSGTWPMPQLRGKYAAEVLVRLFVHVWRYVAPSFITLVTRIGPAQPGLWVRRALIDQSLPTFVNTSPDHPPAIFALHSEVVGTTLTRIT